MNDPSRDMRVVETKQSNQENFRRMITGMAYHLLGSSLGYW